MSNSVFISECKNCDECVRLVEVGSNSGCGFNEALIRNAINNLEIDDLKSKLAICEKKNKLLRGKNKMLVHANGLLKKKLLDLHVEKIKIDKVD